MGLEGMNGWGKMRGESGVGGKSGMGWGGVRGEEWGGVG